MIKLYIILHILFSCVPSAKENTIDSKPDLLTISQAVRILGESAHLADSTRRKEKDILTYSLTFTADKPDTSGKIGNVYFMLEEYKSSTDAQTAYSSIYKANASHAGVSRLKEIGDEGYFHSDFENFYFSIFRKGNQLVRIKVNKITSHTSMKEFQEVVKELAGS